ncbi:MAG: hypothetical protein CMI20_05555 [Opitutae bacterium]|nr:hypothetical protein [Opitutae bacterium]
MGHTETSFRYKIYTIKDPGVKFLSNLQEESKKVRIVKIKERNIFQLYFKFQSSLFTLTLLYFFISTCS